MENQDENKALNLEVGEETNLAATPAVEEQTAEETPVESTEPASTEETPVEETDQKEEPKKGASTRIRELAGEVKSLKQRLSEVTGNGEIPTQLPQPQIDLDSEVTQDQYRQHILQQADSIVQLRMKQSEAISRIDKESSDVMREYPQLDPENDQFDKELSETISDAIEAQVKLNPYSTSVKKIADKLMKPLIKAISNGVSQEKEIITRQVSESALRPTAIKQQDKTAQDMTKEELEAKLGIIQA